MDEEERETGWFRITEPLDGIVSAKQEAAIRDYAREEGFETLRGYHSHLRMLGWDYYDVLRVVSP